MGGGAGGLGDAGNETLDQLDRTLHGAAGIGADVFVGREGDHEVEDALGGIAGSDCYRGSCCVVGVVVLMFFICFGLFALSPKSAATAGGQWE